MVNPSYLLKLYRNKIKRATFIICQSCYWCVSCLKAYDNFPICPYCVNKVVDSIPISDKEFYRMEILAE